MRTLISCLGGQSFLAVLANLNPGQLGLSLTLGITPHRQRSEVSYNPTITESDDITWTIGKGRLLSEQRLLALLAPHSLFGQIP